MKRVYLLIIFICSFSCNSDDNDSIISKSFKILSLGDSYTKGQGVCDTCGYPVQLKDSLVTKFNVQDTFNLKVIAETGWNTSNLISAINEDNHSNDHDLVTLLIGVNNQFQNRPFTWFEEDFPELVNKATELAKGEKENVIIISIPDYANTGFGQVFGGSTITDELTIYNTYIENFCNENSYNLVDAQNLIFEGLTNPELIAPDNLHPSGFAYSQLVTQLLPLAYEILME